uniref:O-fucosyltransferase family protein n=1 Tax=Mucochytrium quahogii TaxID=96639 RepID=A0A7S2S375_9STRA|mmetsp:Transcript_1314/g.2062  ORF Transcript_1314/g.2062 Transcript_1314/m.2062 type:complete len:489 (-) Transcript_1314:42-1508(-)|eukprot:CAMPEP_0203759182 /NCGR_PEP_ID=MMETSP0098-20131031/12150_1 /ASSEMBLY_ACC=CAM_ASM_000208 /TAXON_ID=96639 /ORGANISM=" , Strain NY0313808BC1" /LENGTH=488 /DNA_ID=CAMNT_0050651985 /DNA_START=358 /DNA_END=1824 /DNA_ORIENTATION=+
MPRFKLGAVVFVALSCVLMLTRYQRLFFHLRAETVKLRVTVGTKASRRYFPEKLRPKSTNIGLNFNLDQVFADEDLDEDSILQDDVANLNTFPRTSNSSYDLEFDPAKKYILYNPSGGFNNQLQTLFQMAAYAKMIGRVLLVPPNAKHANGAQGFLRLKDKDVIPMDQCLDFAYLSKHWGIEMMPLGCALSHSIYMIKTKHKVTYEEYQVDKNTSTHQAFLLGRKMVGQNSAQVIFLRGHVYGLTPKFTYTAVRTRYSPFFNEIALAVKKHILGEFYTAMHIRLYYFVGVHESRTYRFVRRAEKMGVNFSLPLYISMDGTREEDGKYIPEILERFENVYFREDLKKHPVVLRLINQFDSAFKLGREFTSDTEFRDDIFGLVEQLICAHSRKFLGTAISTYSKNIRSFRKGFSHTNPEFTSWEDLHKAPESFENKTYGYCSLMVGPAPNPAHFEPECHFGAISETSHKTRYNPFTDPAYENPIFTSSSV